MPRAIVVLLLVVVTLVTLTPPAQAQTAEVALGLAAFAVFNQLFWWLSPFSQREIVHVYQPYAYQPYAHQLSVYQPYAHQPYAYHPYAISAAPAGAASTTGPLPYGARVVMYPHGRYELHGDGTSAPYQWVWVPHPPPPPPAAPAPLPSAPPS